jgi:hypothetical protein
MLFTPFAAGQMVAQLMAMEGVGPGEMPATLGAFKGLLLGMAAHMTLEMFRATKGAAADGALHLRTGLALG